MRLARPAALAVAVAALACAAAAAPPPPPAPTPLLGGGVVRPGEGRGIVHFVFVARWCGPCESEMQALRRLAARMRRADYQLVVVGVARRESPAEFAAWLRALGYDGAAAFDEGGRLERMYGAEALPWHVVVGPGGKVLSAGERTPDAARLHRWLSSPGD